MVYEEEKIELIRYEGANMLEVDLLVSGMDLNELGGGAHKVEKGAEKGVKRQESLSLKKEKQGNRNIHGTGGRRCGNSETLVFYAEPEFDRKEDDVQSFCNIKAKCP